jgi:hypothetical protein
MINTRGVKGAGPPYESMYLITLGKKKFCQVRTILSSDTGNECFLRLIAPIFYLFFPNDLNELFFIKFWIEDSNRT